MKARKLLWLTILFFISFTHLFSQDLLDQLREEDPHGEQFATNTFFSTRVINGQSVENPHSGDLIFIISHHFGSLNLGAYELWGLDHATIRLGLEYGINDRLAVSVGRSSYEKTFDAFFKYKILRQQTGLREVPLSLSWFSGAYLRSMDWPASEGNFTFNDRMSYANQLLIARKFSRSISVQLTPAWVHKTLSDDDLNDFFILGIGGRVRITDWVAINSEYFYLLNEPEPGGRFNTFSVGLDLDTGGHVFQLHFTNAQPMFERGFLTETRGSWREGDIYFGFNITRVFTLR